MDPIPLNKLAYIMCPEDHRLFYNTRLHNAPKWPELGTCCEALAMPSLHPSLQHGDALGVIAAENGHMFCLTQAKEKGLPWTKKTTAKAAATGNFDMLMFLIENQCAYGHSVMEQAAAHDQRDVLCAMQMLGMYITDETMEAAARHGQVKCMKYLMNEHSLELTTDALMEAAANGHCEAVLFVCETVGYERKGITWPLISACSLAAANGQTECVKFIHRNILHGILPDNISATAARTGNLECLRYCAESGNKRTVDTCNSAAAYGQLKCLEYAHRRGYPWDASTYQAAFNSYEMGRVKCMEYLRRHGCPRDIATTTIQ